MICGYVMFLFNLKAKRQIYKLNCVSTSCSFYAFSHIVSRRVVAVCAPFVIFNLRALKTNLIQVNLSLFEHNAKMKCEFFDA